MLKQNHLGILPGGIILSAHVGLDDAGVVGSQHGEEVIYACLVDVSAVSIAPLVEMHYLSQSF